MIKASGLQNAMGPGPGPSRPMHKSTPVPFAVCEISSVKKWRDLEKMG